MNCVNFVCGTGGWTGPKPGDPDLNNVVLRAIPVFGGVGVSWTYPAIFPYAVAYTIIYRGNSVHFSSAIEIARVSGSSYVDPLDLSDNSQYFYWIRLVSVNGTEGNPIGPAPVQMESTISKIISELSGEIREGALHQSLMEKIDRIQLLGDGLLGESKAREQDILAVTRLVDSLSLEIDNMSAAIVTEIDLRISSIDSLARKLTTLTAEFNDTKGIIQQEIGVLVSDQEALARAVTVAQVTADNANAAFRTEEAARIAADQALAYSITTVESEMNGNLAQARQALQTEIRTVDGKVQAIGARYTVQLDVNGLAGGFGVYNDGKTVDAGFLVDRFWIGSSQANKKKPFIIKNGVVYINQAMIEDASITNAKISNAGIEFAKIKNVRITDAHIINGSIDSAKIKNFSAQVGSIADARIGNATIDFAQIRNVSIGSAHIQDLSVNSLKLANGAVLTDKIASGAVSDMASGTSSFGISTEIGGKLLVIYKGSAGIDPTTCSIRRGGTTGPVVGSVTSPVINVWVETGGDAGGYWTRESLTSMVVVSGLTSTWHSIMFPSGGRAAAISLKR